MQTPDLIRTSLCIEDENTDSESGKVFLIILKSKNEKKRIFPTRQRDRLFSNKGCKRQRQSSRSSKGNFQNSKTNFSTSLSEVIREFFLV